VEDAPPLRPVTLHPSSDQILNSKIFSFR
jgi:hypothetical protein